MNKLTLVVQPTRIESFLFRLSRTRTTKQTTTTATMSNFSGQFRHRLDLLLLLVEVVLDRRMPLQPVWLVKPQQLLLVPTIQRTRDYPPNKCDHNRLRKQKSSSWIIVVTRSDFICWIVNVERHLDTAVVSRDSYNVTRLGYILRLQETTPFPSLSLVNNS